MNFEFNTEADEIYFLDTLFDYLSFSGNTEKLKRRVGPARAACLRDFLVSFAENRENEIIAFAKDYFKAEFY
ncbi:MAG: hypothetical protein J5590_09190 [Clostridia bacterium]|nr:hypothetical protein [Clostridia bacterium]